MGLFGGWFRGASGQGVATLFGGLAQLFQVFAAVGGGADSFVVIKRLQPEVAIIRPRRRRGNRKNSREYPWKAVHHNHPAATIPRHGLPVNGAGCYKTFQQVFAARTVPRTVPRTVQSSRC